MCLATIGGLYQQANIYELVVQALWWPLVDEANIRLDLDLHAIVSFHNLASCQ
jgi:hypothetical protein